MLKSTFTICLLKIRNNFIARPYKMAADVKNLNKIVNKEIKADFIYEDEESIAIDVLENPQAPVHFLVIPKKNIPSLMVAPESDEGKLGHLLTVARKVALSKGLHESGFRVVINEGPHSCQNTQALYVHVLGGRQMMWPFS